VAGTGAILGLYGLFAVGSTTLRQRSFGWQLLGGVGVLAATLATVITVIDTWSTTPLGATSGRVALIATVVAFAFGFTGFLLTHQRTEDTTGLRGLMIGTLTSGYVLAVALIIDVLVSSNSSSITPVSTSSGANLVSGGVAFDRFIAVVALLTLLGTPAPARASPREPCVPRRQPDRHRVEPHVAVPHARERLSRARGPLIRARRATLSARRWSARIKCVRLLCCSGELHAMLAFAKMPRVARAGADHDVFHAIADGNRRALIDLMEPGPRAVGELVLASGMSYSATSPASGDLEASRACQQRGVRTPSHLPASAGRAPRGQRLVPPVTPTFWRDRLEKLGRVPGEQQ